MSKSNNTLNERNCDTISYRLQFIDQLMNDDYLKQLKPLTYNNDCTTEAFINPYKDEDDDTKSKDTRSMLHKTNMDIYRVINRIGGKLKYIKSGTTGHTFKGIINSNGKEINYAVKVVAYPKKEKYGSIYDVDRPENAEIMMIRCLSYFVVKRQTPNIVLPISTFNTSIKPFVNLIEDKIVDKDNKKYNEFVERYKKGAYYDTVSILISEWANKGDLLDFFRKHYRIITELQWKTFFFQLISVLAVIQCKYPGFRHNDLKANNILVQEISKEKNFHFTISGHEYMVPNIGYQVKIWDFDFACIPGTVNNAKVDAVWTSKINVESVSNRYYDLHYFFNTLIMRGFFPEMMTKSCIPDEAKEFINRIVPIKYRSGPNISEKGRILINYEHTIPNDVLTHDPYFEEFRFKGIKKRSRYKKKSNILQKNTNPIKNDNSHKRGKRLKQMKINITTSS